MPYMVCVQPAVQIDLMVLKRYWVKMANIVERTGCTYYREKQIELKNGNEYVILRDIKADKPGKLGELIGLFYALEWDAIVNQMSENMPKRFYIMMRPRKKGRKYVQKNRKETGSGREGGNTGKPGDIRPGEAAGNSDDGHRSWLVSTVCAGECLSCTYSETADCGDQ